MNGGILTYTLERKNAQQTYDPIYIGTSLNFTDTGLAARSYYTYRVQVINSNFNFIHLGFKFSRNWRL